MKDFILYCRTNDYMFILYVRQANGTTLSPGLIKSLETIPHKVIKKIP
ncbi:MAG: hypothetical protein IJT39_07240 [Bacteroidales bacterium]|nr:hypothetical protein [Bacteroidales bacterium]